MILFFFSTKQKTIKHIEFYAEKRMATKMNYNVKDATQKIRLEIVYIINIKVMNSVAICAEQKKSPVTLIRFSHNSLL